jgi:hypothetical protein
MAPLGAVATAKHPVLVVIHLQKQLSQRLQRLITFSWLYFSFKNNFRNGSNRDCNGPLQR